MAIEYSGPFDQYKIAKSKEETEDHNIKVMAPWMAEMNLIHSRAFCICGMDPKGNLQVFAIPGMSSLEVAKYLDEAVRRLRAPKKS